jgi:pimeloyl-ACP methyl ester carboxylesterase
MSTFVLCHGSWYGPGSWELVADRLRGAGHSVVAVGYPGDAGDLTPAVEIHQQSYVQAVLEQIDATSDRVTLVGHSMGGMVISLASDERPDQIRAAIYLSAFLLPNGASIFDFSQGQPEFADSLLANYLVIEPEKGISSINPDGLRDAFAADATDEQLEWARQFTQPDYLEPSGTPVSLGAAFERVPRFYIETTADKAVPPAAQRNMHTARGAGSASTWPAALSLIWRSSAAE